MPETPVRRLCTRAPGKRTGGTADHALRQRLTDFLPDLFLSFQSPDKRGVGCTPRSNEREVLHDPDQSRGSKVYVPSQLHVLSDAKDVGCYVKRRIWETALASRLNSEGPVCPIHSPRER